MCAFKTEHLSEFCPYPTDINRIGWDQIKMVFSQFIPQRHRWRESRRNHWGCSLLRQGLDWEADIRWLNKLFLTDWEEQPVLSRETKPVWLLAALFWFSWVSQLSDRKVTGRKECAGARCSAGQHQSAEWKQEQISHDRWMAVFQKNLNGSYRQTIFRHLYIVFLQEM